MEPLIPPSSSPKLAQIISIFDNLDNRVCDSQGHCLQKKLASPFCRTMKYMLIEISDTKIEDNSRGFKLQKANFDMEVNTAVSLDLSKSIDFRCIEH